MALKYLKIFESYWGTIGAGIVPFCKTTKRFLIGLRSAYVLEPHTWGGFGGKLDIDEGVDEAIEEAACRELEEETRYSGNIELIKGFVFKDTNFEYHNFIGIVDEEFRPILNWENDETKWLTYQELLNLPRKHFGLERFLKESEELFKEYAGSDIKLNFDEDF
jgi:8-oxo-dGTP pyrophosphatase MutT (NUDIX family)